MASGGTSSTSSSSSIGCDGADTTSSSSSEEVLEKGDLHVCGGAGAAASSSSEDVLRNGDFSGRVSLERFIEAHGFHSPDESDEMLMISGLELMVTIALFDLGGVVF